MRVARFGSLVALALAVACHGEPVTGPVEIVWDRDACEHCFMTIGDRRAAAQVRLEQGGAAHVFDDLGCALLFIDARTREEGGSQGDEAFAELWVRDSTATRWLDGRAARYESVAGTPMDYGLAAAAGDAGLSLREAWEAIRGIEAKRRADGG